MEMNISTIGNVAFDVQNSQSFESLLRPEFKTKTLSEQTFLSIFQFIFILCHISTKSYCYLQQRSIVTYLELFLISYNEHRHHVGSLGKEHSASFELNFGKKRELPP